MALDLQPPANLTYGQKPTPAFLPSTYKVLLTSWRHVYCTWYGATFSSPLISTLICRRIAPETADLSVLFSTREKRRGGHGSASTGGAGGGSTILV